MLDETKVVIIILLMGYVYGIGHMIGFNVSRKEAKVYLIQTNQACYSKMTGEFTVVDNNINDIFGETWDVGQCE